MILALLLPALLLAAEAPLGITLPLQYPNGIIPGKEQFEGKVVSPSLTDRPSPDSQLSKWTELRRRC